MWDSSDSRLWPIHLKPKPDELLSSWMIRFAHAHLYKAETIVTLLVGYRASVWNRDIDKLAPSLLLSAMSRATGATSEQTWNTTLASLGGYLSEQVQANGLSRWIIPLSIYHRGRKKPGLMFCPVCLAHEETRYFKRIWRLAWSTVCIQHQCYLEDCCPHCLAPITPHRGDMVAKELIPVASTMVECANCFGFIYRCRPQPASARLIAFQEQLEAALSFGYLNWDGNPGLYSHLFFDGLRALAVAYRRYLGTSKRSAIQYRGQLELMPITERRLLMRELAGLVEKWPCSVQTLLDQGFLRASDLSGDFKSTELPSWYYRFIRQNSEIFAPLSKVEAEAIVFVAESNKPGATRTDAKAISGRDIDSVLGRVRRRVSEDDYELLMMSLDQQISGLSDETDRLALLRDKVMFAASYQLRLSQEQLASLTMDEVKKAVPEIPPVEFFTEPRTVLQAAALIRWYWYTVRPRLNPTPDEKSVFTGIRSGRRLKSTFVGFRFRQAVESCRLTREIRDYSAWC